MEKSVVDTKNTIVKNINTLFDELEGFSKDLDLKFNNMNQMKKEIDQKHQDINSFKKVSFIANMNKQLENKNQMIEILERKIISLKKKNEKLTNKIKELDSELIVETEEDSVVTNSKQEMIDDDQNQDLAEQLDEDQIQEEKWIIKELEGTKYLFNSETRKVHIMNKNESPGDIIGRITSKDKFKKYNQPKEYC